LFIEGLTPKNNLTTHNIQESNTHSLRFTLQGCDIENQPLFLNVFQEKLDGSHEKKSGKREGHEK